MEKVCLRHILRVKLVHVLGTPNHTVANAFFSREGRSPL